MGVPIFLPERENSAVGKSAECILLLGGERTGDERDLDSEGAPADTTGGEPSGQERRADSEREGI